VQVIVTVPTLRPVGSGDLRSEKWVKKTTQKKLRQWVLQVDKSTKLLASFCEATYVFAKLPSAVEHIAETATIAFSP